MATDNDGITGYGIKDFNGRPLMFRESQYATRNFLNPSGKSNNFIGSILPKPKFLFFVRFTLSSSSIGDINGGDTRKFSDVDQGIVFQIKQIDKPKFNIKTETLHQYNKKRVVQTGLDYNPMTINFHDDVGDRVLKFWADYYEYHYGDGGREEIGEWANDIVKRDFIDGKRGWGLRGKYGSNAENMHYLSTIDLFQFYGSLYTKISFVNPIITVFDHDNNDYAEGREGTGIRISFDYEGVIYNLEPQDIKSNVNEGLRNEFRFLKDYFLPGFVDTSNKHPKDTSPTSRKDIRNKVKDPFAGISKHVNTKSDAKENLVDMVAKRVQEFSNSATKTIGGGRTFGSIPSINNNSLIKITSAGGKQPSKDVIEKETGIKNSMNNFGQTTTTDVGSILINSSQPVNSGIDSLKIDQAASILNPEKAISEQVVAPGQTTIVNKSSSSEFSRSFGAAAAIAVNEGIVDSVATFDSEITLASADAPTVVNKLPSGKYQLTDRGATILNVMRAPTSAVGVRKLSSLWDNVNTVDTDNRLLAAENDDSSQIL